MVVSSRVPKNTAQVYLFDLARIGFLVRHLVVVGVCFFGSHHAAVFVLGLRGKWEVAYWAFRALLYLACSFCERKNGACCVCVYSSNIHQE